MIVAEDLMNLRLPLESESESVNPEYLAKYNIFCTLSITTLMAVLLVANHLEWRYTGHCIQCLS
jgi:hypothetical protein